MSFVAQWSLRISALVLVLAPAATAMSQMVIKPNRTHAASGASSSVATPLDGKWIYRSFRSATELSDPGKPLEELLFGQGELDLKVQGGDVAGSLGGPGWSLKLTGKMAQGEPQVTRLRGEGFINGEKWVYDYLGYYVPQWEGAVEQVPALVGSIMRVTPHGEAPAGYVAQWIAVKKPAAPISGALRWSPEAVDGLLDGGNYKQNLGKIYLEEERKQQAAPDRGALRELLLPKVNRMLRDEPGTPSPPAVRRNEVELVVEYANLQIGNDRVRLRTYNGALVGPVIRAKAGETLYLTLRNKLPVEAALGHGQNTHHEWNTTNLHFHGLHVAPQGPPGVPDEESDNVLLELKPTADSAGSVQKYAVRIPANHPAGTFWYHAHRHGSTAGQVASGMAGALIIERNDSVTNLDSIDAVARAGEEIMVLQQIPYLKPSGTSVGFVERSSDGSLNNDWALQMLSPGRWGRLKRYVTVNGELLPTIRLAPQQVRRFRIVHAGQREPIQLRLERANGQAAGIPLREIAVDGLPLGEMREHSTIELFPGYRSDVLVQPMAEGEYYLADMNAAAGSGADGSSQLLRWIAKIVVEGPADPMALPTAAQLRGQRLPDLAGPVTGTQHAFYGIVIAPSGAAQFFITDRNVPAGGVPTGRPFGSQVRPLELGKTERWIVGTRNGSGITQAHPFHIHVNPFRVESVQDASGVDVTQAEVGGPTWRDTLAMKQDFTYRLLTRYDTFVGDFVNHCHILDHEDNGMMELVRIAAPPSGPGLTPGLAQVAPRVPGLPPASLKQPSVTFFVKGSACPHCMEQLQEMATALRDKRVRVAVVSESSAEDLKQFPKMPFQLIPDPQGELFQRAGVMLDGKTMHGTVVRNGQGEITLLNVGRQPYRDAKAIVEALGELSAAREEDSAGDFRETTVSQIVDARVYNSQRWPRNLASVVKGQPTLLIFYRNWDEGRTQLETLARHFTQLQALRMRIIAVGAINSETLKAQLEAHPTVSLLPIAFFADAELSSFRANGCLQDDSPLSGTLLIDSDGAVRWSAISETPFNDGEEILRQATDTLAAVEIEIRGPTGADDYLSWAAAQARIRLRTSAGRTSPPTVVLKNRDPGTAGSLPKRGLVRFAGRLSPGETATQRELTLVLPLDGSWVDFYVAGDSQFPSSRDKDCHIDVVAADSGQLLAAQPLMVRVRKDARGLSSEEWTEFLEAVSTLHKVRKEYESFVEIHDLAAKQKNHPDPTIRYTDQAHSGPGFLPWHRVFLLQFERKLQQSHPHVAIPFWRQDQTANFFDLAHMGTNRHPSGSGFQGRTRFDVTNPLNLWYIEYDDQEYLQRAARDHTLLPTDNLGNPLLPEAVVIDQAGFRLFAVGSENNPHNLGHNWVGAWMQNCRTSPSDPLFWVFHCEYDRLWAKWQYIYELFCTAQAAGTNFLVRTCVNRRAGRGDTTVFKKMERQPIQGEYEIEVQDKTRKTSMARVQVRFARMTVHPPVSKQKHYPALSLTVIHARERGTPAGREPIRRKLLTNLPVEDLASAIEKLNWYAQRWKIETFHKVLKSGCKAEESKLRTAERLTNLLAVLCVVGWRVFWLTMVNRATPTAAPDVAFTKTEVALLDRLTKSSKPQKKKRTVTDYLVAVAKLGGYLARGKDPPPGNMVLWRGLSRLTDIHMGFELWKRCG